MIFKQLQRRRDDRLRRHQTQTIMMPQRANALVAKLAGNVVIEHSMRDIPGSMLGISQGIEIYNRCAERGSNMYGTCVIGLQWSQA